MKLIADSDGRIGNVELFRPKAEFEATVERDGSVRIVELTDIPIVKPRMVNGRLTGADIHLPRNIVANAIRAERDAR